LDEHCAEQPDLVTLSAQAGLSQFHLHRLFSEWAGITPKAFLQCLTLGHAKQLLLDGESVLKTSLDVGLSGPSRLHDLCVRLEAASPGEIKSGGADWSITAGFAETPFGICLLAESPRGICHLSFVPTADRDEGTAAIHADWPRARIVWNQDAAGKVLSSVFTKPHDRNKSRTLKAIVRGTEFQVRVWRSLLAIPPGSLVSYSQIAASIRSRSAARSVGSAVGQNRLAFLIPCHRVIRETGAIGDYRWGAARKKAIIAWESGSFL
jgi:AraC family transcriptional regulator of adaptative response/methylated-DNA-[protein]-cysteine methyltransferase